MFAHSHLVAERLCVGIHKQKVNSAEYNKTCSSSRKDLKHLKG